MWSVKWKTYEFEVLLHKHRGRLMVNFPSSASSLWVSGYCCTPGGKGWRGVWNRWVSRSPTVSAWNGELGMGFSDFSVTALSDSIQWNRSLRWYSVKQPVLFIWGGSFINHGECEGVLLKVNIHWLKLRYWEYLICMERHSRKLSL